MDLKVWLFGSTSLKIRLLRWMIRTTTQGMEDDLKRYKNRLEARRKMIRQLRYLSGKKETPNE